jgi:hypothetical protein
MPVCPLLVPCSSYAEKLFTLISPVTSSFTVCAPGDVARHLTDTGTVLRNVMCTHTQYT